MTSRAATLLLLATLSVVAGRVDAQNSIKSSITLSSLTLAFPTPTAADYDAGFVAASSTVTATFDSKKNAGGQPTAFRTSTISIRATSATMGGTKPIGDLTWQRNGAGSWTPLTTSDVSVESRVFIFNGQNDPWSVILGFRTNLGWANTPPATYSATIVFTLTVTTP